MILPYQEYSSELLCLHAYRARNPFKFMAAWQVITNMKDGDPNGEFYLYRFPHQLDASASAYQLISYFLFNQEMAESTNLIIDRDLESGIQDIYSNIYNGLKSYISNKEDSNSADLKFLVQSALVIAIPSLDKRFDSTHSTTGTVAPCLNNLIGTREPYSVKKETP